MALDAKYFDSIYIEVVKKKYYNAGKVQAVFEDIRKRAEKLNEENEQLRSQVAELNGRKAELGDALLSAQSIYQEIVERAKKRAAEIVGEAERRRDEILEETRRQQDYSVRRVEEAFARIRQIHLDSVDAINAEWQEFLCGLYPETEEAAPEETPEEVPEDLAEKVGAIADQMLSLEEEN